MPGLDTSGISYSIRDVTPADAKAWLELDHRPQRQTQRYDRAYAREMSERRWQLNGDSITFSNMGHLLDGRKRLRACILSGASFPTIVVRGIKEEDFKTIDALRARTAVDTLFIRKERFPGRLSAVLNIIYRYYRYYQYPEASLPLVTSRDTLFILDVRPDIRESVVKTAAPSPVGGPCL